MKIYRAYFNRHADWPFVWSVDEGSLDTEIKVKEIVNNGAESISVYDHEVAIGDQEKPRVWFQFSCAKLSILHDVAYFSKG